MRLRILTLPDDTWTVVIDQVDPSGPFVQKDQLDRNSKVFKEATGARGVLWMVGQDIDLPADGAGAA